MFAVTFLASLQYDWQMMENPRSKPCPRRKWLMSLINVAKLACKQNHLLRTSLRVVRQCNHANCFSPEDLKTFSTSVYSVKCEHACATQRWRSSIQWVWCADLNTLLQFLITRTEKVDLTGSIKVTANNPNALMASLKSSGDQVKESPVPQSLLLKYAWFKKDAWHKKSILPCDNAHERKRQCTRALLSCWSNQSLWRGS